MDESLKSSSVLRLGLIGLDTSHVKLFSELLMNPDHPHYVPGARIVAAFSGGSPDVQVSANRVEGYKQELRTAYGIEMLDSPEAVAEQVDGLLLTAVDGRTHPELFRRIAPFGKPTFVDKPFAVSQSDSQGMAEVASRYGLSWMSSSVRRYAASLVEALASLEGGEVVGAEAYGPLDLLPELPDWYWYGIHIVETAYAALGTGCKKVTATADQRQEVVTGVWGDGRTVQLRGNRGPNNNHGLLLHRQRGTVWLDTAVEQKSKYATLLERLLVFFQSGVPDIAPEETLELIRFIEAVNESRLTGKTVYL
ncbi:Gfo/Idh/MocA family protein [Paenibacillus roseipurpureus]|uniref:Gfo/Idh/MocA family oxidoreductase n=1 Tax=Paenibacillus roseopurpureus TaxID=2918901 RepID=A0AA96LUQ3_9BACL|nr:gfo/Idh/MocA family oxidoreductase [Paenibacillus sp. MBLB1832]WNR46841.1 gfo/Idh/MocA family oxidoreductase [Paenibacillus sp. MBLB1832]